VISLTCIFSACPNTGSYSRGTSLAALATEATSDARSGCRCASSCQIPVYLAAGRDPQGLPITICNKPGEQPGERGASGVFGLKGVGDVVGRLGAADRAGLVTAPHLAGCDEQTGADGLGLGDRVGDGFAGFGGDLFACCHFRFPFLGLSAPCLILPAIYQHADILSTPKRAKKVRFFIGNNRRHLRKRIYEMKAAQ